MLARHPAVDFSGVWARRSEAAEQLASVHGTTPAASIEELCDRSDAILFCVPPDVQVPLALTAAARGCGLLLEKPVGMTVAEAEALTAAVAEAGVVTQLALTWRYAQQTREFIEQARASSPRGGRAIFVNEVLLGGRFATPWRLEQGPLLDLGPHLIDILDVCLGTVRAVTARGRTHGWITLILEHGDGVVSEVAMCSAARLDPELFGVEIVSENRCLSLDLNLVYGEETMDRMLSEFVDCVRTGRSHDLDVRHGLRLQRLLASADEQLVRG